MSNRSALLFAIVVLGIAALGVVMFPVKHNKCICVGECKPNPCEFMWDAKTGKVLWEKLRK